MGDGGEPHVILSTILPRLVKMIKGHDIQAQYLADGKCLICVLLLILLCLENNH